MTLGSWYWIILVICILFFHGWHWRSDSVKSSVGFIPFWILFIIIGLQVFGSIVK